MRIRTLTARLVLVAAAALAVASCSGGNDGPTFNPPTPPQTTNPPPPATPTRVVGSVAAGTRALDQAVSLELVSQAGVRTKVPVAANGTFSQEVPTGMYTVVASRPGYEPRETAGFVVNGAQDNRLTVALTALPRVTHIGHDQCAVCHRKEYDGYIQSGHPWKIIKIKDGKQPQYPPFVDRTPVFSKLAGCRTGDAIFGTETNIDCPKDWGDVAYTLGGFYKLRFILKDGHVMGGTRGQYDVPGTSYLMNGLPADGSASSYTGQRYDCGGCHTTGFRYKGGNQDNLPGIRGNWKHDGVQCEACHGAGAGHAQSGLKADITRKRMTSRRSVDVLRTDQEGFGEAISCYECHGRDSNRNLRGRADWPSGFDAALAAKGIVPRRETMGGRIRVVNSGTGTGLVDARTGDQVWAYWPAAPATMAPGRTAPIPADRELTLARSNSFLSAHGDCSVCHNLHASTRAEKFLKRDWYTGPKGVDRSNEGCQRCHALHDPKLRDGGMKDLKCVDCHTPYVSYNGTFIAGAGQRPPLGDNATHVWRIDLGLDRPASDPLPQYTNQLLATPAKSGFLYPYLTMDLACRTCHHDQAAIPNINGVDRPGSYPASFQINLELLKTMSFRFHNNLPANPAPR